MIDLLHGAGHNARMRGRGALNAVHSRGSIRRHDVTAAEAVLRRVRFDLQGTGHRIVIAPNASLSDVTIRMQGAGHTLQIASHVCMTAGLFDFYDTDGTITVGERTRIYGAGIGVMEGGTIHVGERCLLSSEIDIRNGDSHSIIDRATGRRLNESRNVWIGDHVWIGARAMILKGARVGDDCVIGASSTVTGEIPDGCVAIGTPARTVLEGVDWRPERV